MRINLYNISIRNKLIIAIQAVTITVLLVSSLSYIIFTSTRDKESLIQRMEITAKLVGEYAVSPLVFGDELGGKDIISRISSMPEILSAFIIDEKDSIFAEFYAEGNNQIPYAEIKQQNDAKNFSIWTDELFFISQPIVYKGDFYGKIALVVSLNPFKRKLINDLQLLLINMFLIFVFSWMLSLFIQQYISKPIKKLVKTTNKIVTDGDYSLRVNSQGNDEIGQLYVSYNKMLERITLEQLQQQKYSKALELSESNYRTIFENSIVGIFNIDINSGQLIQANDRFYEILHLNPQNISKYTIENFLSKREIVTFLKTLKKEGQIENFEIQYKEEIWISFSGKRAGEENHFEGVIQDITERKQNYLALNKVNYELDNFVYHASHDLRSPLRSILGLTNLLKYENTSESSALLVDKIESSINRLDNLVTDLLTFSKNSRTKTNFEQINFEQLIKDSLEQIPLSLQEEVHFSYVVKGDYPFHNDKTRIAVIINNLLVNAHKYQRSANKHKEINLIVAQEKTGIHLTVQDNGEGIAPENQSKIFDMFYRASEASEGSGLGLYIVKNVVETLSGHVYMRSTFMKGTTFEVVIPNQNKAG